MELYPREIDVTPGKAPQARGANNRQVRTFDGSGVIIVRNNTNQQNAFRVSVHCDGNPYWQPEWYTLDPITPTGAAGTLRADDAGPGWVKVFVPANGMREINLLFRMPERPDSRAGVYPLVVDVEASVGTGAQVGTEAGTRGSIRGTLYVHPYYKWRAEFDPQLPLPERHVKRSRPTAEADLVIENQGNDYLYLDATVIKSPAFTGTPTTARITIPPPDRREPQIIRRVPVALTATQRPFRGPVVKNPVQVQVTRVEAPSLAPPPGAAGASITGLPQGAVLAAPATQGIFQQNVAGTLVYHPPLPNTVSDFFTAIGTNARGLVMVAAGLVAASLLIIVFVNGRATFAVSALGDAREKDKYRTSIVVKDPLPAWLRGRLSDYSLSVIPSGKDNTFDPKDEEPLKNESIEAGNKLKSKVPAGAGGSAVATALGGLTAASFSETLDAATIDLSRFKGKTVKLYAKRGGLCAWVNWLGGKPVLAEPRDGIAVGKIPPPPPPLEQIKLTPGLVGLDGKVKIAVTSGKLPVNGAGIQVLAGADPVPASAVKVSSDGKFATIQLPPTYASGGDLTITVGKGDPQTLTVKPGPTPAPIPPVIPPITPPVPNGAGSGGSEAPGGAGSGGNNPGGSGGIPAGNNSGGNSTNGKGFGGNGNPPTPSTPAPPSAKELKIELITKLANPQREQGNDLGIFDEASQLPGGLNSPFAQSVKALTSAEQAKIAKTAGDLEKMNKMVEAATTALTAVNKVKKRDAIDDALSKIAFYVTIRLDDGDASHFRQDAQTAVNKVKNDAPGLQALLNAADTP